MRTKAWPLVAEYIQRENLAALGFTSSIDELDWEKANIFLHIKELIRKKQQDEQAKQRGK